MKLRIRFIFYQLKFPAGIERSGVRLINELSKSHNIEVFVLRRGVSVVFDQLLVDNDVYVGIMEILFHVIRRHARPSERLYEIVVGSWATSLWPIFRFRRTRVIIWEKSVTRNRIKINGNYKRIYRLCRRKYRRADLIIVNSRVTELCVLDGVGNSVPVSIIPNIVDEKPLPYEARNSGEYHRKLISIGGLIPIKNPTALPALMRALPERFTLDVLGDGPLRNPVEIAFREMGLESRVTFHGFVDDPTSLLESADILLHPSLSETFCLSAFEAAVRNIPVACMDVDALSEFVPDLIVGAKASFNDTFEFQKAVLACETFIGNNELFDEARDRRLKRMSPEVVVLLWNKKMNEINP